MRKNLLITVSVLLLFSSVIFALTLAKATVEELTQESTLIVHGIVQKIENQWENQDEGTINSFVTIDVFEYIKGMDESSLVIRQMGGQIGDWGDVIPGTPVFSKGDEVILFLVKHQNSYEIHSIALGLFRVYEDDLGQKMVINDLRNINLIDPVTGNPVAGDEANPAFTLSQFRGQIRSYLSD